jgi:uncharacterized OsmC-like protein
MSSFDVAVGAGTLRHETGRTSFAHRWTPEGVTVDAEFTGGHVLNLAVAGCVLNDVYREADRLGIPINGVRVRASGSFNTETWSSTGITYSVEVDTPAPEDDLEALLGTVDSVAEIPKAIRAGATVERTG